MIPAARHPGEADPTKVGAQTPLNQMKPRPLFSGLGGPAVSLEQGEQESHDHEAHAELHPRQGIAAGPPRIPQRRVPDLPAAASVSW